MCKICSNIPTLSIKEALAEIEKAIKNGKNSSHFDKVLDVLLGIKEVEENKELDEIWERKNRLT